MKILRRADWSKETDHWVGRIEGAEFGAGLSLVFFSSAAIGMGPPRHTHEHDTLFVIRQGRARFEVGETMVEAEAGDVLYVPAGAPHRFENLGPGRLEVTDVHQNDRFTFKEV